MKIEIWFDIACPYCFLGKKRFDLALERFGNREAINLELKSFEVAPDSFKEKDIGASDMLMEKYERRKEEVKLQLKELGIEITLDDLVHTNTFKAHRLIKYSKENQKALQLTDSLFDSFFIHKEDIGNHEVLFRLACDAGLDKDEVDALLCLNHYSKAVRHDEELAEELGISTVPFFIFNEEYAVSGAQPTEFFLSVLEDLWQEELALGRTYREKQQKSFCEGNDCSLD